MIDESLIKKARQADLASYLLSVGVQLIKNGNRYKHKEHDSLTFTENAYYWNSKSEHGNAIDYLTNYMDMSFTEAVSALSKATVIDTNRQKTTFKECDLSLNQSEAKAIAYLNKTRHVGYSIIEYLLKNRLLLQEKRTNNAIFPMYNENNYMVGAELQGTLSNSNLRFKKISAGSKYGYGFNVRFSNDNTFDYALFFESAVDLISFIDYKFNIENKSLDRCILVSMAGRKANILRHTLTAFKGDLKAVLCVDNDEAGQAFKNEIENEKIPFKICAPDEKFKDWNDQITALRNNKVINRVLERHSL